MSVSAVSRTRQKKYLFALKIKAAHSAPLPLNYVYIETFFSEEPAILKKLGTVNSENKNEAINEASSAVGAKRGLNKLSLGENKQQTRHVQFC